jgi:hypothetical protein
MAEECADLSRKECIELLMLVLGIKSGNASTCYNNYIKPTASNPSGVRVKQKIAGKLTKAKKERSNSAASYASTFSFKNKQEFINDELISRYIEFLAKLIAGEPFKHAYTTSGNRSWSCDSLPDAKIKYDWHGDYQTTAKKLRRFSAGLQASVKSKNQNEAFYWAMCILDWGGVQKSMHHVIRKYDSGLLCQSIKDSCSIMVGENYDLRRFDGADLFIDSGLTKIISLASDRSIILDSRVVAGMFLLATKIFTNRELSVLEKQFIFIGGKSTSKSAPSKRRETTQYKSEFVLEPIRNKVFPLQAHVNLVSNWILQTAIEIAKHKVDSSLSKLWDSSEEDLPRSVEAALFMIGADISAA